MPATGVEQAYFARLIGRFHRSVRFFLADPFLRFRWRDTPLVLQACLRSGAWVCGEPAWDPEFNCADLFLLLLLARLEGRYSRRYVMNGADSERPQQPHGELQI